MQTRQAAFTLIELLVSMALIAIVATVATTTFFQIVSMSQRLQTLQTMDASAKTTYEKLNATVTNIHPCSAVWLTSKSASKDVEFVFMHSKFNSRDYINTKQPWDVSGDLGYTDLVWSRWHWNATTEILEVSTSREARWILIGNDQSRNYWKIPGGSSMGGTSTFISVPQLQRETGTATDPNSPIDLLNLNGWQSGEATDVGDYDDLLINATPLLYHCTDLTIELQNLNGAKMTADGTANLSWAAPGTYVNGENHSGLADRPSIVRIRFTLTDPKIKTSSTFSFSCTTPSFTHY